MKIHFIVSCVLLFGFASMELPAQAPADPPREERPDFRGPPDGPEAPPREFRPGFGGPPRGVREDRKLVEQFDKDGNKRLDAVERQAAREFLAREKAEGRGPRRFGPPRRQRTEDSGPIEPGPKVSPADVPRITDKSLYDPATVRTLFLEFEGADWEKELADFYHTDVEVPATLTVDGRVFREVGVHYRGASSFFTVSEGRKRSLNLSLDFVHEEQRLDRYRTLNLLNSHTDPTFLRTVLYHHIARQYIAAPKANYVRVVVNGESWGVFVNAQQVNKDFTKEWFGSGKGARWKVPGSPRGNGGLTYLGEDVSEYRKLYEIKSKDEPASWTALMKLCRVLNETPAGKLEAALEPILDIEGVLKFLALENALINSDGYWVRASDYYLYRDVRGRFHVIPHDANETFRSPGGPGMNRGAGGNGVELDPLAGAEDPGKPLLSKLLAVPELKQRYLGHVRAIANEWLDWEKLGPLAELYQSIIAEQVKADTRKLYSAEAFSKGVTEDLEEEGFRGPRRTLSLKSFADQRRAFLLNYTITARPSAVP